MADLSDMLSDLLSDPSTKDKLRALLDDNKSDKPAGSHSKEAPAHNKSSGGGSNDALSGILSSLVSDKGDLGSLLGEGVDPAMILKLTRAMSAMNSKESDSRAKLLYDLKPYISKERGKKVDEAAQMLKLLGVLDIFRDD